MSTPNAGPDALRRLIAEAIGTHEVVAASLGLNATDLRCLELASSEPEMTPTRLAELSDLTSGAVTGVLDRLERAGFVRREFDPSDRRRLLVRVDPDESEALVAKTDARPMEMRGREMRGWIRVDPEHVRTKRALATWVERGTSYARSLPPKR